MNMSTSLVCLVLVHLFSLGKFQSTCPSEATNLGPCIAGSCPTGSSCMNNNCCSGTGAVTNCVDLLVECPKSVAQCNVNTYRAFMTTNCPKTCNRCGVTNCADTEPLCTQWAATGFCQSTFYTTAQKQSYCKATCGYC